MIFCEKVYVMLILTIFSLLISVNEAANSDKKQDAKCLLPMEPGPCRMNLNRFYYNAHTDTCEEFKFGGCKGNENKFGFKQTCEAACKKSTTAATAGTATVTSTTTKTPALGTKNLNSNALTSNLKAASSTTTPISTAARTTSTDEIKSSTPRSVTTTTTQKSNRF